MTTRNIDTGGFTNNGRLTRKKTSDNNFRNVEGGILSFFIEIAQFHYHRSTNFDKCGKYDSNDFNVSFNVFSVIVFVLWKFSWMNRCKFLEKNQLFVPFVFLLETCACVPTSLHQGKSYVFCTFLEIWAFFLKRGHSVPASLFSYIVLIFVNF